MLTLLFSRPMIWPKMKQIGRKFWYAVIIWNWHFCGYLHTLGFMIPLVQNVRGQNVCNVRDQNVCNVRDQNVCNVRDQNVCNVRDQSDSFLHSPLKSQLFAQRKCAKRFGMWCNVCNVHIIYFAQGNVFLWVVPRSIVYLSVVCDLSNYIYVGHDVWNARDIVLAGLNIPMLIKQLEMTTFQIKSSN